MTGTVICVVLAGGILLFLTGLAREDARRNAAKWRDVAADFRESEAFWSNHRDSAARDHGACCREHAEYCDRTARQFQAIADGRLFWWRA